MTEPTIVGMGSWHDEQHVDDPASISTMIDAAISAALAAHLASDHEPIVPVIQPGQDIAAMLATNPVARLAPGSHTPFVLDGLEGVDLTFEAGASVHGATRVIEIYGGSGIIRNPDVYDGGSGFRFMYDCDWIIEGGKVHDNQRMVRNDTTANNDFGAMGFAFDDVTGLVLVANVEVYNNRVSAAMPSIDYGLNEGSAFELWRSKGIIIDSCKLWDNQIAVETGSNDSTKPCGLSFRNNLVRSAKADATRKAKGVLWRSGTATIEHNVFENVDDWAINPTGGGSFGTPINLTIRDNLTISPAAAIQVGAPVGTFTHDYNAVAGTKAWGSGGADVHGLAVTDPMLGPDYLPLPGSPLIGKGHDGSDIGLTS